MMVVLKTVQQVFECVVESVDDDGFEVIMHDLTDLTKQDEFARFSLSVFEGYPDWKPCVGDAFHWLIGKQECEGEGESDLSEFRFVTPSKLSESEIQGIKRRAADLFASMQGE